MNEPAADLALAMLTAVVGFSWPSGAPVEIRIGINTGPLTAGVIGKNKFAYDIWGDTVNTADRMQAHSPPGAILASEATFKRLEKGYRFEEQAVLSVKGKGDMKTFILKGKAAV